MSGSPYGLFEALQVAGAPICASIARTEGPCVALVLGQQGSFLDLLAQSCAAGASRQATVWSPDRDPPEADGGPRVFGATDGVALPDADSALAAGEPTLARFTRSLDRAGLAFPRVAAIALDADAVAASAWRGARALIARDRPAIVAHPGRAPAERLYELAADGYALRRIVGWSHPRAAPILLVATPREGDDAASDLRLIAPAAGVPAGRAVIGAEALAASDGLYPAQRARDGHLAWTGPRPQADLRLPQLWHGPVRVAIRVARTFAAQGMHGLSVLINGRPCTAHVDGDRLIVEADIPAEEFAGTLRLALITPELRGPDANDPRLRGTAIAAIEVDWTGGR
jgi:hypothetical protein